MDTGPRSNRPTPRTPAAIEAELRRRLRAELSDARAAAEDGTLDDAMLAAIIARAIGAALAWHLESPEHARGPRLSGGDWRSAPGPRGRPEPRSRPGGLPAEPRSQPRGWPAQDRGWPSDD